MSVRLRKFLELSFIVFALVISVAIFINRNRIENVGNVGYLGLFILCILANATVFLPSPGLMIAISCSMVMNPIIVTFVAALGCATGELVGYAFGSVTADISPKAMKIAEKLTGKIKNRAVLVFLLALLPLPLFDLAGVYSGSTKMNVFGFYAACFAGKLIKVFFYVKTGGMLVNLI